MARNGFEEDLTKAEKEKKPMIADDNLAGTLKERKIGNIKN